MVIHLQDTCAAHTAMMRPIRFDNKTFLTVSEGTGDCPENTTYNKTRNEAEVASKLTDCLSADLLQILPECVAGCLDSRPVQDVPFHFSAHETVGNNDRWLITRFMFCVFLIFHTT